MTKTVNAYAKINLFLEVTGLLDNGFHSVNTVMQSISLCDEVTVTLTKEKRVVAHSDCALLPEDDKNIAVRAARLFLDTQSSELGVQIYIKKNIPLAAGLAGGSADAAATLIALNSLFGEPLDSDALCAMAARLGADVPFCISCGTSFADSKGDVLHECPPLPSGLVFVVACMGEGVSTPVAYGTLDECFDRFVRYIPREHQALLGSFGSPDRFEFCKHLYNIFEEPIADKRPTVKQIKQIMADNGARAAMMSGSGPSVFGVFEDVSSAEAACTALREKGSFAALAFSIEKRL